ncbi:restriction endonuclease subunit S [Ruminococcus sp. AM45-9BH]|uniref:restriction endonuclease subunit S n=1 Tax=Blautia producta TaxID=33035 RepID=UPI000E5CF30F|nr:restriction endonuclease subunit S [Lachnospiraceae bacterium]RHS63776.1 restriction endonuclease subunit S [Ruminococcus sp. AM45-9BH]RHS77822.1 restriction endonuclease subunit S [Ruminococcus sp. AM45-2]
MKRIAIKNICEVYDGPHATPKKTETGPVYLGIDAITEDGMLDSSQFSYLSKEDYIKWTKRVVPQENDIVFSYEATLGKYALIPRGFYGCLGRRLAIIRVISEEIDAKWLYYYFRSPEWNAFIKNQTVKGSTVDRISVEEFPNYTIPVISLKNQKKMVAVLEKIDAKIRTNNKINDYLEEMAKTIYDYWFIQFDFPGENGKPYKSSGGKMSFCNELNREIPQNWNYTSIGNITICLDSERIPLSNQQREGMKGSIPYYGATGIMDYVNRPIFSGNFVLLAEDGSVMDDNGNPILQRVSGDVWINNHTHVLQPVKGYSCRLLYLLLKDIPVSIIKTGSIQMKINQANLNNYNILSIPDAIRTQFINCVEPLDTKIMQIQQENNNLIQFRDWLLPMLMNGQATIEDCCDK